MQPYSIPQNDPITNIKKTNVIKRPKESKKTKLKKKEAQFDDLLSSIFEANDSFAQDTSERSTESSEKDSMWLVRYSTSLPCLSNAYLVNLEDSIRKLESSTFYKELEVEKIINLQRILERAIKNGESTVLSPSQVLDLEYQDIVDHTYTLDNTLKAIKVLFRIWISGRTDKALFSEDLLTEVTEFISKIMETEILPLCEQEVASHPILKTKNYYSALIQELCRIFELYSNLISTSFLNESSVTKLEFLSIKIVFFEVSLKPKDMLVTFTLLESLKVANMLLISTLFGYYPDQHSFLLDEILSNFAKVTGSKSSRVYHCSNGISVQLVTALITKIIQTVGPTSKDLFNVFIGDMPENEINEKRTQMTTLCTDRIRQASKNSAEILQYLISRAIKTTKTGDSPFRSLIESFTDDFAKLLTNPEWPAAELLLTTLSISLMNLLDKDNEGVTASTMALELLGNIAMKIGNFKKNEDQVIELALNISTVSFNEYCDIASQNLGYLQSLIPKGMGAISSYQYFLTLFTSILTSIWHGTKPQDIEEVNEDTRSKIALHEAAENQLNQILARGKEGLWVSEPILSSPEADKNYKRFLFSRNMVQLYDRILNSILRSLNHSKINIRTKALRTVSSLLAQSPDIFSLPQVQKSLSERIVDVSTQVREASVDIVGKYMVFKPQFAKDFYMVVCDRSSDTGAAVRKRVIKLLHSIYHIVEDEHIKIEITERIIRRIDDEEKSISELSTGILTELFFPPMKSKSAGDMVDEFEQRKTAREIASILLAVWSRGDKNSRFLRDLFIKLFHPIRGTASPAVKITAKYLIEDLVEQASQYQSLSQAEKILGLLSDIIGANGSFMIQDHLMLLSGFISDESPEAQNCCYYTLCIFHKTLDKMGPLRPQLLKDLQGTLLKRLGKFNFKELSEAIPCLWVVSVMKGEAEKVAKVCKSCMASVEPSYRKALAKTPVEDQRLNKFLFILGNIGQYCNLDEYITQLSAFQQKNNIKTTLPELIIAKCTVFADPVQSIKTRKMAIKNICNICTTHPLLFLSAPVLKVLDAVFKDSDDSLKDTLMRSFTSFLYYEEDVANAKSAMKNTNKPDNVDLEVFLGVTDKFHNDGASASLMQRYLTNIMDLALSGETEFAHTACLLLERIIRQGLANPRIAISTIIALETSKKRDISVIGREMHTKLHDKHESLIDGSYVEGAKHAANYRIKVSSNLFKEFDNFSGFYHFLKNSRQAKKKFLLGLCRTFDFEPTQDFNELDHHIKYLVYMSNSLSTLHFYMAEEVMYLIHGLDKIISSTGVSVSHYCEKILEKFQETEQTKTESTQQISEIQEEETIDLTAILDASRVGEFIHVDSSALAKSSGSTQTIVDGPGNRSAKNIEETVSPEELERYARSAVLVNILWDLRQFLRKAYNFSEERIQSFDISKLGKDPKAASRSVAQMYEKLDIDRTVDLNSSFTENPKANLARIEAFVTHVSPDSLNPDDYFDGEGDETLVSNTSQPATKKRSHNGSSGSHHGSKKSRHNND